MNPLSHHPFVKMNGLGNEIVVLDLRDSLHVVTAAEATAIARVIPYDQMMVLHAPQTAQAEAALRIYNNDGSLSGACGNGTRCVAWVLLRDSDRTAILLESAAGPLACLRLNARDFTVDMGAPRLGWAEIPLRDDADTRSVALDDPTIPGLPVPRFGAVNVGNPHAVFFVGDGAQVDVAALGSRIETHPMFPQRVNVSFARVVARDHIRLDVWERGVGITRACGSAACATLVAAARNGLTERQARVTLPGGDLLIAWREDDDHVLMTGPTEYEYEGRFDPVLFADAAV